MINERIPGGSISQSRFFKFLHARAANKPLDVALAYAGISILELSLDVNSDYLEKMYHLLSDVEMENLLIAVAELRAAILSSSERN